MPYKKREQLPDTVKKKLRNVPKAKDVYKEAFNNAYEHYADPKNRKTGNDREASAHAVAWSAVKEDYEKGEDGLWHKK